MTLTNEELSRVVGGAGNIKGPYWEPNTWASNPLFNSGSGGSGSSAGKPITPSKPPEYSAYQAR